MWVKLPPSQSYTDNLTNTLIKKSIKKRPLQPIQNSTTTHTNNGQFPFDVSVFNRSAGQKTDNLFFNIVMVEQIKGLLRL